MLSKEYLPGHIAFIMDGNGRWARERGLPRTEGHREGAKRVKEIIRAADDIGISVVTFYAFSAENWSRPKREVAMLMRFLDRFLHDNIEELDEKNIKFLTIGRQYPLPRFLLTRVAQSQERTQHNTGLKVVLALNYGARQEIVDAVKKFAATAAFDKTRIGELSIDSFNRYLYTADLPDPDLLIRTSGEMRISNFLLWQLSYAELCFPKIYWPDFTKEEFLKALEEYHLRERRFGNVDTGKKSS